MKKIHAAKHANETDTDDETGAEQADDAGYEFRGDSTLQYLDDLFKTKVADAKRDLAKEEQKVAEIRQALAEEQRKVAEARRAFEAGQHKVAELQTQLMASENRVKHRKRQFDFAEEGRTAFLESDKGKEFVIRKARSTNGNADRP